MNSCGTFGRPFSKVNASSRCERSTVLAQEIADGLHRGEGSTRGEVVLVRVVVVESRKSVLDTGITVDRRRRRHLPGDCRPLRGRTEVDEVAPAAVLVVVAERAVVTVDLLAHPAAGSQPRRRVGRAHRDSATHHVGAQLYAAVDLVTGDLSIDGGSETERDRNELAVGGGRRVVLTRSGPVTVFGRRHRARRFRPSVN